VAGAFIPHRLHVILASGMGVWLLDRIFFSWRFLVFLHFLLSVMKRHHDGPNGMDKRKESDLCQIDIVTQLKSKVENRYYILAEVGVWEWRPVNHKLSMWNSQLT
jgi:hypothetical protein